MPRILETCTHRLYCGSQDESTGSKGDAQWGHVVPDRAALDEQLAALAAELSEGGWEIKAVTPLIASYYYAASQYMVSLDRSNWGGYGVGYGAPYTEGLVVVAQRWVEITREQQDERERRGAERAAAEAAAALEARRQAREVELARLAAEPVGKAGLLRDKWRFRGQDYPTEALAQSAKEAAYKALRDRPL
ncbi:hypothetical protein DK26_07080 [Bosea sp. WAO]|uniref:hypothetical protein n=1 Tax=Bosea sp. WAO TaxID=406341 RepID=UPI000748DE4B|nr:hypothetical protein [Bosea sp. WAO]KUL96531.1 hypothetical protein DK26_07080 [Bosea sp. WAO]